jgi:phage gp16-like protein
MSKEILSQMIYDQLQADFANQKARVSNPASEFNQQLADKLAAAIVMYLDTVHLERMAEQINNSINASSSVSINNKY